MYLYKNISCSRRNEIYIYFSLIQRELKNCKGELEINGDKVAIKPGQNLKVKNDSGKVQYIGVKHKIKKEERRSQYIRAKHKIKRGKAQSNSS